MEEREKRQEKEGKIKSRLELEIVWLKHLVETDGKRSSEEYRKDGENQLLSSVSQGEIYTKSEEWEYQYSNLKEGPDGWKSE